MKLVINKDRSTIAVGTWGTENENNYEVLHFEFPQELQNYNKRIVYYLGDEKVWDVIVDDKAYITNAITKYEKVKAYVWCTKTDEDIEKDIDFRTKLFEMNFYENENADGIVPTEEQVDGFNTMLTAMSEKIDEVDEKLDGIDEIVNSKIEEIDTKIDEVDEAVTGIENLNIDVSDKVDGDVSITLTKKNGVTKTVVLSDGTSLMFHWDGTRLGIKTDKDEEYVYVDLKGAKGDTGPRGEPGSIKFIIVQTLPTTDIEQDAMYLVPITPDESDNNYAEYIYVDGAWEQLGKIAVHVDLSDYVKNTDYATNNTAGAIKSSNTYNFLVSSATGIAYCQDNTYEIYQQKQNNAFISKGTLENVITGKGLTTKSYVDELVGNIESILETLDTGSGV